MGQSMIGGSSAAAELAGLALPAESAPPIGIEERHQRIDKARALMDAAGIDALLIGAGTSLNYFSGLGWGMIERLVAMVIGKSGQPIFICPKFEEGSLQAYLKMACDLRFWEEDQSPYALVGGALNERCARRVALDPALPYQMARGIQDLSGAVDWVSADPIIDACRGIKSPAELALLRQAKRMTLEVQRRAARILVPGIRASEVARFINDAHQALGARGSGFCSVQFGSSTAFPHGLPQDDVLAEGDLVLIDTGCSVDGYQSDITRTYIFGEPTAAQRTVWQLEQEAQQAAFDAVRPGVACQDIDAAARTVLAKANLGPDYRLPGMPHRTGHGIGLAIHEGPYLVRGDRTLLQPGMCFSNEPMIVIPGEFGIRLEDHFFVTETGAEWFTSRSPAIDRPFV